MSSLNWAEIAAKEYTFPEGTNVQEVLPELLTMLGNPDPVVRDEQAYTTLAVWTDAGHFDRVLRELGDACAANLSSENVLLRSFSALILAECVRRQKHTGMLDMETPGRWYDAWANWYPNEPDVRSYEDGIGWIHTVAHGADFAREWALYMDDNETLRHLFESIMERIRTVPMYLHQTEDDRLALALLALFSRENFDPETLDEWSNRYRTLWTSLEPGVVPPSAHLAVKTLQSLHTLLHLGARIDGQLLRPAHPREALNAVQDALRSVYDYYGEVTS